MKNKSLLTALVIGFMLGIIMYSVVKGSWGLLTLIPLYFIYKLWSGNTSNRSNTNSDNP